MAQMISKVPGSSDGLEFCTVILQVLLESPLPSLVTNRNKSLR